MGQGNQQKVGQMALERMNKTQVPWGPAPREADTPSVPLTLGHPGHCGGLSGIPEPRLLYARSTPRCDSHRCPQTPPSIPRGTASSPGRSTELERPSHVCLRHTVTSQGIHSSVICRENRGLVTQRSATQLHVTGKGSRADTVPTGIKGNKNKSGDGK